MITDAQINELVAVKHKLAQKDREFADSLIAGYTKYNGLTAKQEPWVVKLIERAATLTTEIMSAVKVGSVAGVIELFEKAAVKLKYPAIVLTTPVDGAEIRLTRATKDSKNPGCIYVRRGEQYVGKITPQGEWVTLHSHHLASWYPAVSELLELFATDPANVAAAHGKLTGKCCFCNSALTDQKSLDVGYGPVCAKHYDLPWGSNWSQHAAAVGPAILAGDGQQNDHTNPLLEAIDEVVEFEKEAMADKAKRRFPTPIPGRACKDLLEMANA